nr:R3H domain-containing nucleic acid-binding protein [Ornithinimicrobium cryptoxanthini]
MTHNPSEQSDGPAQDLAPGAEAAAQEPAGELVTEAAQQAEPSTVADEPSTEADEPSTEADEADADATPVVKRTSGRRAELEHEGDIAADFLETLLDIADLDGDLEVNVEGDRAAVAIVDSEDGAAPKALVGHGGDVLEALQELTRLAVQAETGERSRLMLDVAGHRAGRRAELVELARATSARVKESGERAELEPMSAFERKVVHDEVLAAGLVSESEGTEPTRHVVILPQT